MKRAILVLGSICLLSVPLRAYIYTSVIASDNYRQTQPSKLVHVSTGIYAGAIVDQFDGNLDTADDVTVLKPNGDGLTNTAFSSSNGSLGAFYYEGYASRKDILDGSYLMTFFGGTLNGEERDYHVSTKLFPDVLPQISARSFRALSSQPVSTPIEIVFHAYRVPKGADAAITAVAVSGASFDVNVDSKTSKVVIPAGTLEAGKTYSFSLTYLVYTVSGPEMLSQPIYFCTNSFTFTTSSSVANSGNSAANDFDEEEAEFSRLGGD